MGAHVEDVNAWFDSPHFSTYYGKRDDEEAAAFVRNVLRLPQLAQASSALDLCCGDGRHAAALCTAGLRVTGVDGSKRQIASANARRLVGAQFIHGRAETLRLESRFDIALNLHTSFGFGGRVANRQLLMTLHRHLREDGYAILDYWNGEHRKFRTLRRGRTLERESIRGATRFRTEASIVGGRYIKRIEVGEPPHSERFLETVALISRRSFLRLFRDVGLVAVETFGSRDLGTFTAESSDRLIFLLRRRS